MEEVGWGIDSAPARFPGATDGRFAPTDSDDPWALPGVRAASRTGFEPAPEAPIWTFLPAVWPASARIWIPDIRVRHKRVSCESEPPRVVPWSTADYFEMESDANELLAQCGLPPRPGGRLWLLMPPRDQPLDDTLLLLVKSASASGLDVMASAAFVEHIRRTLPTLFEAPR